jgi:hypothetical protein
VTAEKLKSHTHATPQVYLRRFALDGELMTERPGGEAKPLGTPVVGVRRKFYTLSTAEGGSNLVEDQFAKLEGSVKAVFAQIDQGELPLSRDAKVVLGEFIGMQVCRGVTYREHRRAMLPSQEPRLRERLRHLFRQHAPGRIAEAETYDLNWLIDQNSSVAALVDTGIAMTNVLVNMRWQIARWSKPVLLSSDQPTICWHAPHQSSPWGLTQAAEIRMPLSPDRALVATWHDGGDPAEVISADRLAALTMNHHTERHAVDWLYWRPGTEPIRGHPLYDQAISGPPPSASARWQLVAKHLSELLQTRAKEITVFSFGAHR